MKKRFGILFVSGTIFLCLLWFVAGCSSGDGVTVSTASPSPTITSSGANRSIGYFTSWGVYERGYEVADIPVDKLTHINYAFFDIDESTGKLKLFDEWADIQKVFTGAADRGFPDQTWDQSAKGEAGNLGRLRQLKAAYPKVRTMMSLGGWSLSYKFPAVAKTEESRRIFVASCIEFMEKYDFDGIDVDWEFPTADNTESFTLLMEEFRKQLDAKGEADGKHYELSFAAPVGFGHMANLKVAEVASYIDFFNIMAYDFHGGWESTTNHNAPLYMNPDDPTDDVISKERLNISWVIDYYVEHGVAPGQINLGIPLYGRAWEEVGSNNNGLFQNGPSLPDTKKDGNWEEGMFDYWKIQQLIDGGNYTSYMDENAKVPWLYGSNYTAGKTTGGMFVSYENVESLKSKVSYIKEKKLGGIMFWELSGDVRDVTSPNSLLRASYEYMNK